MLVAAPLLVLGRPALALLWALPDPVRRRLGAGTGWHVLLAAVAWLRHPLGAWWGFTAAFVFWHLPGPYTAALADPLLHATEHVSLLATAAAFWAVAFAPAGRGLDYGARLLHVATAAVLGGLPGALMILAPRPLYRVHGDDAARWGLTLVQDQQLAGLVMWIPGGLVYLLAAAWLFTRWLDAAGRPGARRARRGLA
jgi:cytochrome c oxidase assembly factor CtaG